MAVSKLIDNLINFIKGGNEGSKDVPEGYCPNCWGKQEYGGNFFKAVKNQIVDINKVNDHRGWIQDYADKNLSSIELHHHKGYDMCEVQIEI